VLARIGLNAIRCSPRPGMQALLRVAGIADKPLTGHNVGFMLAPRINAAGRVGHAELAARLLLTQDESEAATLAAELDRLNVPASRSKSKILAQATELVEAGRLADRKTICRRRRGLAPRCHRHRRRQMVDRFSRPCIVVAFKDDRGKGSGRSVTGFDSTPH